MAPILFFFLNLLLIYKIIQDCPNISTKSIENSLDYVRINSILIKIVIKREIFIEFQGFLSLKSAIMKQIPKLTL